MEMNGVMDARLDELQVWLRNVAGLKQFTIAPASNDASFRRYFRVRYGASSLIAMDAPPDKEEDCAPFVAIARAMAEMGLNVPRLHGGDLARGFLLLSDLGAVHYLAALNESTVEVLYGDAMRALRRLQAAPTAQANLPPYDRALLLREMGLFPEWFLGHHLGVTLDERWQSALETGFSYLAERALAQPRVWVHRDYHSRNLMVTDTGNPGVLDFQDAVLGPLTYDLVSLLRDCYIRWPRERVVGWANAYLAELHASGLFREVTPREFIEWFDLMGVQRHLKAIGIFARLNHRDGKSGYLGDIPRTLGYVMEVAADYGPLRPLDTLLRTEVAPNLITT